MRRSTAVWRSTNANAALPSSGSRGVARCQSANLPYGERIPRYFHPRLTCPTPTPVLPRIRTASVTWPNTTWRPRSLRLAPPAGQDGGRSGRCHRPGGRHAVQDRKWHHPAVADHLAGSVPRRHHRGGVGRVALRVRSRTASRHRHVSIRPQCEGRAETAPEPAGRPARI